MKETSSNEKTNASRSDDTAQRVSAGPQGIAIAPPAHDGGGLMIQPRLMVGAAGDSYEREADHVAQQVMRMDTAPPDGAAIHPRQSTGGDGLTQRKPLASGITPLVQRSGTGGGFQASSQVVGEVSHQRGRGSALDGGVRQFMEPRFGADFSGVRVHTNPQADTLNRNLSARAFTTGRDIFFRGGEYRPGSASGRELIAHELTHVVQQSGETSGGNDGTVQRLVVNTGHPSFREELKKPKGWIVASDMDLAYQEGGSTQDTLELDEVKKYGKTVGRTENIYLEGHGAPGYLGITLPSEVAKALNSVIPIDYQGRIRSHSCSAGAKPSSSGLSGIEGLARSLSVSGIEIYGASSVALNHALYQDTYGTRSFGPRKEDKDALDTQIDNTIGPVNIAWAKYVRDTHHGTIERDDYPDAAAHATTISVSLYEDLIHETHEHMLPESESLSRTMSLGASGTGSVTATRTLPSSMPTLTARRPPPRSGGDFCFITTACTQAKGLSDDCLELTTLRAFRDEYMMGLAKGREMIKVYYENSPAIVEAINAREDAPQIYDELYEIICRCVRDVQNKEYEHAFETYVQMVIELRNRFTPLATVPAFFYQAYQPNM